MDRRSFIKFLGLSTVTVFDTIDPNHFLFASADKREHIEITFDLRKRIVTSIDQHLRTQINNREIYLSQVICNETNNTPMSCDKRITIDIIVKPIRPLIDSAGNPSYLHYPLEFNKGFPVTRSYMQQRQDLATLIGVEALALVEQLAGDVV